MEEFILILAILHAVLKFLFHSTHAKVTVQINYRIKILNVLQTMKIHVMCHQKFSTHYM